MPQPAEVDKLTGLASRFGAFVAEQHPFALTDAIDAFEAASGGQDPRDEAAIEAMRPRLQRELARRLEARPAPDGLAEPTPRTTAAARLRQAHTALLESCDGFLRRAAIAASLTRDERVEILRGMILTRATDNRLKAFFLGGEVRFGATAFQGKGFRSLGQEAIYAAPMRLRRGERYRSPGRWQGDVIGPMIRDLGATFAMRSDAPTVRMVLNSQMAKAGPPTDGKDFGYGDMEWGIMLPASPLTIATLTLAGMAMAFKRDGSGRVAVSFIGEGGSSLGEWHEAINLCAARRLPMIFCVQNNQTALSTPVTDQSAVRVFADKAAGYGVPGVTLDGTDPE
ncbi:MAG TPA: thiamine pyrophosphate-dependent enzyme, partial [Vicinamibacterales bacterium]|nr:thiamine pyrophosphate-dependent enzyme [Vicinamibacterales bacterium]